jgi:3',5'-cyclic AMP phosphodiesterase CpdA
VFWITDTQYLSMSSDGQYQETAQWIADHYVECNGRMVVHTGDMTQDGTAEEWSIANQSMSILLDNGIPYTWDAGNHDGCVISSSAMALIACDSSKPGYLGTTFDAFNPSYVASREPGNWVGSAHDGMDTAVRFTSDGQTFLVINIEFNGIGELGWARSLISQYGDAHVIIATHAYLDSAGSADSSEPDCAPAVNTGPPGLPALTLVNPLGGCPT